MSTVLSVPLSSSPESLGEPSRLGQASTSNISFLSIPGPAASKTPVTTPVPDTGEDEIHYAPGKRPLSASPLPEHPLESKVGPPPPSPPASVGDEIEPMEDEHIPESPKSHTPSMNGRPITFEEPPRQPPSPRKASPRLPPSIGRRSSADTDVSQKYASSSVSPRLARAQSDGTSLAPSSPEDGLLHPPHHVPSRRNTTGSASILSSSSRHPPTPLGQQLSHDTLDTNDNELGELASDIQQQAEQIRKERLSKRKAQEAEQEKLRAEQEAHKLARTTSLVRAYSNREEKPVVGNLIGEGHVNYVLMFNMLTGIRVSVSRCQAKIRRPLTDEDYQAAHKYSFDFAGNELTPSTKYDFKFKDYAPWVFRELREDYFQLDPADYLLSLTAKYILSELGSPGKSGSFFYFSRDYRFIIKTIHHNEHKFLRRILKQYHEHVKSNPHTLLSRFYGLHRVKLPRGRKIHFVIMNNLFPPHKDVHETYDLKGSTVGREYPEEKLEHNPRAVLKDLNWINRGKSLELGPEKRALLTEQIRRDAELLKRLHVMDYSLLVGIHNMVRGNRDNVRRNTLKVFSPDVPILRRKPTMGQSSKGASSPEAIAMRRVVRESDPQALDTEHVAADAGERQYFLFYQDEGGLRATDEANEGMDTIYYLGIIDILTPYNTTKKLEHLWKGLQSDRHKISPVPPEEYADRFFSFMKAIMRGGEGGTRFKSE
ncbi:phosphatidylinositol phosphate kinase-like protein [Phanerochaete sordida]|uniref:1-phosphatidylinositol-4-phosphate 5-kinase n=1 Tax=Phanerochaete sordida TaxID=48140 RepID=A0A9P3GST4_9APHY|nr:phosphatidylinositol phosphate kinase-like protein [Phanerochaete sordida]